MTGPLPTLRELMAEMEAAQVKLQIAKQVFTRGYYQFVHREKNLVARCRKLIAHARAMEQRAAIARDGERKRIADQIQERKHVLGGAIALAYRGDTEAGADAYRFAYRELQRLEDEVRNAK